METTPQPTPTQITGNCCLEFPGVEAQLNQPFNFEIKAKDGFDSKENLIYNVNLGDGNTLRNQDLGWDHQYGYIMQFPHIYHSLGLKNAYILVDNLDKKISSKCAKVEVNVIPASSTPTPTLTPTNTQTPTKTQILTLR